MVNFTLQENFLLSKTLVRVLREADDESDDASKDMKRVYLDFLQLYRKETSNPNAGSRLSQLSIEIQYNQFFKTTVPKFRNALMNTMPSLGESADDRKARALERCRRENNISETTNLDWVIPCWEVLKALPEFAGDFYNVDRNMCAFFDIPRPMGYKAARRAALQEANDRKRKAAELAALEKMNDNTASMAKAYAETVEIMRAENLMTLAKLDRKLGNEERAKRSMDHADRIFAKYVKLVPKHTVDDHSETSGNEMCARAVVGSTTIK